MAAATRAPDPVGSAPLPVVALLGRCPRCGRGALFRGLVNVREACPACGLELSGYEAGDGPAVAGIFLVGAMVVIAALVIDARYEPPLWVHALIWPVVILGLALGIIRVAKAVIVAMHHRHRAGLSGD